MKEVYATKSPSDFRKLSLSVKLSLMKTVAITRGFSVKHRCFPRLIPVVVLESFE